MKKACKNCRMHLNQCLLLLPVCLFVCCTIVAQCLLRASQPHPDNDLEYSSYTLNMELIPGVKVFSDSGQTLIGNTVASLGFVCDWLYTTGHHLSVLKHHNHILTFTVTLHLIKYAFFYLFNLSTSSIQYKSKIIFLYSKINVCFLCCPLILCGTATWDICCNQECLLPYKQTHFPWPQP